MALGKVHTGDTNTDIILTIQETINGTNIPYDLVANVFSVVEIIISDPDGNETTLTASVVNTGSDGKIHKVNTDSTLFDESGAWTGKGKVTLSDGSIFTSNKIIFEVLS